MKKDKIDKETVEEMQAEYRLSEDKAVRGKYHRAYREGHSVRIHGADGTVTVQHFTLQEGSVMLEPDVRSYFPTSESVNKALRLLIELAPRKKPEEPAPKKRSTR